MQFVWRRATSTFPVARGQAKFRVTASHKQKKERLARCETVYIAIAASFDNAKEWNDLRNLLNSTYIWHQSVISKRTFSWMETIPIHRRKQMSVWCCPKLLTMQINFGEWKKWKSIRLTSLTPFRISNAGHLRRSVWKEDGGKKANRVRRLCNYTWDKPSRCRCCHSRFSWKSSHKLRRPYFAMRRPRQQTRGAKGCHCIPTHRNSVNEHEPHSSCDAKRTQKIQSSNIGHGVGTGLAAAEM